MTKQQLIQEFIESKISKKEFLAHLNKFSETELLDFLECLLGKYGGIIANEILLEFSEFFILKNDFLKLISKIIAKANYPLVHFSLFEFFMLLGITNESFYASLKIELPQFKPYESFFSRNSNVIGSNSRFNTSVFEKLDINHDKLESIKSLLLDCQR